MTNFPNILIVDDDPEIAMLLKRLLQSMVSGEITVCNSIAQAHNYLNNNNPTLAFIDINLGDGIGYSLVPNLLLHSQIRIVIMSATGLPDEDKVAESHGAHYFLTKPFSLNDVKQALLQYDTLPN